MNPAFNFDRLNAFGWIIHRKVLHKGDSYLARVSQDLKPAEADNITLWTKGEITGQTLDGARSVEPRLPGRFSRDYTHTVLAGEYIFTAMEDSEWWCINWTINRKKLPTVSPFRLPSQATAMLTVGQSLLLCSGTLVTSGGTIGAGSEVSIKTKDAPVLAQTNCYGLFFHD